MEIFNLTLTQMLVMFALMLTGYILRKGNFLPENSSSVISKLLAFVLSPALTLGNQIKMCTPETFINNSGLMFYGLVLVLVALGLSYPLSALIVKNPKKDPMIDYKRNIYRYALTFGNWGYMGNYIILGIGGDELLFRYTMFTFFLNLITCSWGVYVLVPKSHNSGNMLKNLKQGILTPPFIAIILGMVLGISGVGRIVPTFVTNALDSAGSCMGPMAMILAGFVVGEYDFSQLLKDKKVYIVTFLRLIVIPAVFILAMKFLGIPKGIIQLALVCFAAPLGLNTVVYPAAYGGETRTGASMAMISHVLSVITIPIMYLVFIELL